MSKRKYTRRVIEIEGCRYCEGAHKAELVECTSCDGHGYGPDDNGAFDTEAAHDFSCDVCDCHGRRYVCQTCGAHFANVTQIHREQQAQ